MKDSFPVIRAVVFDLDGLLIDTEPIFVEVARRLVGRRGKTLDETVIPLMMGTPARQAIPLLRTRHGLAGSDEEIAQECGQLFFDVLGVEPVRFLPGAAELLACLAARRVPLALATSSSRAYVRRVAEPHAGFLDHFQHILTCDDVTHGKPHPEIYRQAAARLDQSPADVLVLEDSVNGLRSAKAAGAHCIVVPHGLVPRSQLASADAILESLADPKLYQWLSLGHG
jgi:HAD superfamily hydrolase (TIGR01509 family)